MATIQNGTYYGTELKFAFTISATGFDMETDDFTIILKCGSREIEIPKTQCIEDENNAWFFVFDSTGIGPGMVTATFIAEVPDEDFDDGFRREKAKIDLIYIRNEDIGRMFNY